eukprot:c21490_g1_i3.p1 GENE.c21490_g1_i3~~c21490_g1_i3.p1  ORF type:complete len:1659 (+),score=597.49 c21490_g1_i3:50-4978(+)
MLEYILSVILLLLLCWSDLTSSSLIPIEVMHLRSQLLSQIESSLQPDYQQSSNSLSTQKSFQFNGENNFGATTIDKKNQFIYIALTAQQNTKIYRFSMNSTQSLVPDKQVSISEITKVLRLITDREGNLYIIGKVIGYLGSPVRVVKILKSDFDNQIQGSQPFVQLQDIYSLQEFRAVAISQNGLGNGTFSLGNIPKRRPNVEQTIRGKIGILYELPLNQSLGEVFQWEFYVQNTGILELFVLRKVNGMLFKVIGMNTVTVVTPGKNSFNILPNNRIQFQKGDFIGFRIPIINGAELVYDTPKFFEEYETKVLWSVDQSISNLIGNSINFTNSQSLNRQIAVNFVKIYSLRVKCNYFDEIGYNIVQRSNPLPMTNSQIIKELSEQFNNIRNVLNYTEPLQVYLDPSMKFKTNGTVIAWKIEVCAKHFHDIPVIFQVWRKVIGKTETVYKLVGQNIVMIQQDPSFSSTIVIPISISDRIEFRSGDVFGWAVFNNSVLCFDDFTQSPSSAQGIPLIYGNITSLTNLTKPNFLLDISLSSKIKRSYSISSFIPFTEPEPAHLVLGSFSSPSHIVTINTNTMTVVSRVTLSESKYSFLSDVVVDDITKTAIFGVHNNPTTVLQVGLLNLEILNELNIDESYGCIALTQITSERVIFIASNNMIVRVNIDWMEVESGLTLNDQTSLSEEDKIITSLTINPLTNILYIGLVNGKIIRINGGNFLNRFQLSELKSNLLYFKPINSDSVEDKKLDLITNLQFLDNPSLAPTKLTNQTSFEIYSISRSGSTQSVLTKISGSIRPILISFKPAIGHISGKTKVNIIGSNFDDSTVVLMKNLINKNSFSYSTEGSFRLVNTVSNPSLSGRLEILYDSQWSTIPYDFIDSRSVRVICQMMGYTNGLINGPCLTLNCGSSKQTVYPKKIVCEGFEKDISYCQQIDQTVSGHSRDAIISCEPSNSQNFFMLNSTLQDKKMSIVTPTTSIPTDVSIFVTNENYFESEALKFSFYNATIISIYPNNMPSSGQLSLTIAGNGFGCDNSILLRYSNSSKQQIEILNTLNVTYCSQNQVTVTVENSGNSIAGQSYYIEVAFDGQYWTSSDSLITLTNVTASEISRKIGIFKGGNNMNLQTSGIISTSLLGVGMFLSPSDKYPFRSLTTVTFDPISQKVSFITPSVLASQRIYWGVTCDGQNYAVSKVPFDFYLTSFTSLYPSVALITGGSVITVKGSGFVKSTSVSVKLTFVNFPEIVVEGVFLGPDTITFTSPSILVPTVSSIEIALDGITFEKTGLTLNYVNPTFQNTSPSCFMRTFSSPISVTGNGFPLVPKSDCIASFQKEGVANSIKVSCIVESSTSINIPKTPTEFERTGSVNLSISFDGGDRFISTKLNLDIYVMTIENSNPSIISSNSPSFVTLFGKGFVQSNTSIAILKPWEKGQFNFGENIGEGWNLVRRVRQGENYWHPTSDHLSGSSIYGKFENNYLANSTFSIAFNTTEFDEFLFASGDLKKWLIVSKKEILKTGDNILFNVTKSSKSSISTLTQWRNSASNLEDPIISISDYSSASLTNDFLYRGYSTSIPSSSEIVSSLQSNGGMNVFIRKRAVIATAIYVDETRLMFLTPFGMNGGIYDVFIQMGNGQPLIQSTRQLSVLPRVSS